MGVLQVINAQDENGQIIPFLERAVKLMMHFASIAAMAMERAQMTRAILLRMIKMAEMRDPKETGPHVNRVAGYAVEIYEQWAKRRNHPQEKIDKALDKLRMAAMLHDVGKVAISDLILKKPGKLNDDEFRSMKKHSMYGAQLFRDSKSDYDHTAAEVALNHHERWDGRGYPGNVDLATGKPIEETEDPDNPLIVKAEEGVPLFGRIVALADVYDALSSARVYKPAFEESDVFKIIQEGAGSQFDPELVEIFFSIIDVLRSVQARFKD